MEIWCKLANHPNSPEVSVVISMSRGLYTPQAPGAVPDTETYGCHALMINNATITIQTPSRNRHTQAWEAVLDWGAFKKKHSTRTAPLYIPPGISSQEEYESFLPPEEKKVLTVFDLPASERKKIVNRFLNEQDGHGRNQAIVFVPVINYEKASRYSTPATMYRTHELIKLLMEFGGGSWYGLPVMSNGNYTANGFGKGLSLFQVVVWNRWSHAQSPTIAGSAFEYHPSNSPPKPIGEFLKQVKAPTAVLNETEEQQVDKTYHSLKNLANNLTKQKSA